jgi:biopolymer transport protein ExbB
MKAFIEGTGVFIWPLGACSILAAFIILERLFALRTNRVAPSALLNFLSSENLPALPPKLAKSLGGRIVLFFQKNNADPDTLKAFAQIELTRLERGLFLLDTIVGIAPLIGLLGTVYGLFSLFPGDGLPNAAVLTRGVGIALSTTILGLLIAIPALVCSNYIARRLELLSAQINMAVERLCTFSPGPPQPEKLEFVLKPLVLPSKPTTPRK